MSDLALHQLMTLLVEPSTAQGRIITRQLRELKIDRVAVARQGEQALAQMRATPPDLVISALYLPDMTGTELLHRMKRDPGLEQVPFVLISSETRFRYLDPVRQAGAVAILPKPFGVRELKAALDTTLEHLQPEGAGLETFDPEELEILIVDDSGLMRKHIRRVLEAMGLERLTEARDGMEALELIGGRFFDLVVTDYNMPRMDGQELVDRIRSDSGQSAIPILMVTSERDESRLAAVQKAGVSAICDKPFEPGSVRRLLRQVLEG